MDGAIEMPDTEQLDEDMHLTELEQLKRALSDCQHTNHVLTKALNDVCSGRVTFAQLKGWWERGENPKLQVLAEKVDA